MPSAPPITKAILCGWPITPMRCGTAACWTPQKRTVCFADSPFARARLTDAAALCADGQEYPILDVDDHDAGWLMVTLDIDDATILWDQELTTK